GCHAGQCGDAHGAGRALPRASIAAGGHARGTAGGTVGWLGEVPLAGRAHRLHPDRDARAALITHTTKGRSAPQEGQTPSAHSVSTMVVSSMRRIITRPHEVQRVSPGMSPIPRL